jgi:hypothetical protein
MASITQLQKIEMAELNASAEISTKYLETRKRIFNLAKTMYSDKVKILQEEMQKSLDECFSKFSDTIKEADSNEFEDISVNSNIRISEIYEEFYAKKAVEYERTFDVWYAAMKHKIHNEELKEKTRHHKKYKALIDAWQEERTRQEARVEEYLSK